MENTKKYTYLNGKRYIKYSYIVRNKWSTSGKNDGCFRQIGDELWELNIDIVDEPIIYWLDYLNKNEYVIIPNKQKSGVPYRFDFGSVPTWGRWISTKTRFVMYLIHDRLYDQDCQLYILSLHNLSDTYLKLEKYSYGLRKNFYGEDDGVILLYNQKFADKVLYRGIKEENKQIYRVVKPMQERIIYLAVRIGGGKNFHKS